MKLPLAYYGAPILRKKASPILAIDQQIHQLVLDMTDTMEANDGCGLAAPQVHQSLALFITCIPRYLSDHTLVPGKLRVFINPKIVAYSSEMWACQEGCLSIPDLRESVLRPLKVTIQATNLEGQTMEEEFVGFDAHVMMHENDHLNGVLYIDRLPPKRRKELESYLKGIKKKYPSRPKS